MSVRTAFDRLVSLTFLLSALSIQTITAQSEEFEPVQAPVEKAASSTAELDRILQNLRGLKARTPEEKEQFMKLHKTLSNGYASEGFYRQAYDEYVNYLDLKEELFQKEHSETVIKAKTSVTERSTKLEEDLQTARVEASNALASVKRYDTFRLVYQQFFSIGIVVLTVLFSLSFVRSGSRLTARRKETDELRKKLLGMHRAALTGRLAEGIRIGHKNSLTRLGEQAFELGKQVSAAGTGATAMLEKLGKDLQSAYRQN